MTNNIEDLLDESTKPEMEFNLNWPIDVQFVHLINSKFKDKYAIIGLDSKKDPIFEYNREEYNAIALIKEYKFVRKLFGIKFSELYYKYYYILAELKYDSEKPNYLYFSRVNGKQSADHINEVCFEFSKNFDYPIFNLEVNNDSYLEYYTNKKISVKSLWTLIRDFFKIKYYRHSL